MWKGLPQTVDLFRTDGVVIHQVAETFLVWLEMVCSPLLSTEQFSGTLLNIEHIEIGVSDTQEACGAWCSTLVWL